MHCCEFHNRWQTLLDERKSPEGDPSLVAHARECDDCAEFLRLQSYLFQELKRGQRASAARRLPSRRTLSAQIEVAPHSVIPSRSRAKRLSVLQVTGISLAIAGSLLVVAIPALRSTVSGVTWRGTISVATADPRPMLHEFSATRPTESGMATDAVPASEVAPQHEALRQLMEIAVRWPVVPEPPKQQLEGITGGFRSFADSLGGAWNALRRTFPSGSSQPAPGKQAIFGWPVQPPAAV